jgi:hypothetical protein
MPRSGSTEFGRLLSFAVATRYARQSNSTNIVNLLEFFNPRCSSTFGNSFTADELDSDSDNFDRIFKLLEIKNNAEFKVNKEIKVSHVVSNRADFFNQVDRVFKNKTEILSYLDGELQRRQDFLNQLPMTYILKHFITSDSDSQIATKLLNNNNTKIFYYRKDIIGSVFSALIKHYYFNHKNIDAHNWHKEPIAPIELAKPITLTTERCRRPIAFILKLFQFYKENQDQLDFVWSYEDIFIDNKLIEFGELGDVDFEKVARIANMHNLKDKENPMPYALDKESYFTNPELVKFTLNQMIAEYNLSDEIYKLGIVV